MLLAHIHADGLAIQACDISPIELIINKKLCDRYDWVPWTLQFLQFARKSALLRPWTTPTQYSVLDNP